MQYIRRLHASNPTASQFFFAPFFAPFFNITYLLTPGVILYSIFDDYVTHIQVSVNLDSRRLHDPNAIASQFFYSFFLLTPRIFSLQERYHTISSATTRVQWKYQSILLFHDFMTQMQLTVNLSIRLMTQMSLWLKCSQKSIFPLHLSHKDIWVMSRIERLTVNCHLSYKVMKNENQLVRALEWCIWTLLEGKNTWC